MNAFLALRRLLLSAAFSTVLNFILQSHYLLLINFIGYDQITSDRHEVLRTNWTQLEFFFAINRDGNLRRIVYVEIETRFAITIGVLVGNHATGHRLTDINANAGMVLRAATAVDDSYCYEFHDFSFGLKA
jgi:hypothetical protein